MKEVSKKLLTVLIVLSLITRLIYLGSGLNVIEPDEQDYQEIAGSAVNGWPLYWQGSPYFEKFPLFIYLSYFLGKTIPSLFVWGPYVNLRLISVAAFIGLIWLFFKYLNKKIDATTAFITCLFLLFNPLMLFYSRQGTYELFYLFFGFAFFYFFDQWEKLLSLKKTIILSGLLALAVLAKHINFLLYILPGFYLIKNLFSQDKARPRRFLLIILSSSTLIFLALLPVYLYSEALITQQFLGVPQQFFITHPRTFLSILAGNIKLAPFWLSWSLAIGGFIGIIVSLRNFKKYQNVLIVFFAGFIYINSYYITPRSFIFIVPYLLLSLAIPIQKLKVSIPGRITLILLLIVTIAQSGSAFLSTLHQGVEKSLARAISLHQQYQLPIYSTFEEKKLSSIAKVPINLLNQSATNSGIIITDERKTDLMLALTEPAYQSAKKNYDWIKSHAAPVWEYIDPWPHFPGSIKSNVFRIYIF
ncbi:MAG: glycosyltransferase family 39 protein [Patescibacteria group bacterium]|nr:glycosyltransferase family 39 protein [Patescibacteria group bacterium]